MTVIRSRKKQKRFDYKRTLFVAIVVIAVAAVGVLAMVHFKKSPVGSNQKTSAHTTSKSSSAQSDFTGGGGKSTNRTTPNANNTATDTGGSLPKNTSDQSNWTASKDGSSIVVMSPANASLFMSGDTLYGTAKSSTISYELEDDVSGVILQGQANVVDGKFSVKLNFSTTGTSGRINVFNQAPDGTESNNLAVNVKFK